MERRCARGVGSVSGRRERSLGCEHMFDGGSAMDEPRREQAAVLALVRAPHGEWYQTAVVIAEAGSVLRLLRGEPAIMSTRRRQRASELVSRVRPADLSQARALIDRVTSEDVGLITILEDDYPEHLKLIFNRPPFLWLRGQLEPRNLRAIAVVGTRQATQEGRASAARLARGLAAAGVTVLSGLARGIDTAAHAAALDARGRTVAVVGTALIPRELPRIFAREPPRAREPRPDPARVHAGARRGPRRLRGVPVRAPSGLRRLPQLHRCHAPGQPPDLEHSPDLAVHAGQPALARSALLQGRIRARHRAPRQAGRADHRSLSRSAPPPRRGPARPRPPGGAQPP